MSQYKAASRLAQGSLLQYQLDKHKADPLNDTYHTTIAKEFKDVKEKYNNLQRQYAYMVTQQRLEGEYGHGSK